MEPRAATIEVNRPGLFDAKAVTIINGYGVLLATPVVVAILLVSLMRFSVLTVLLPLLAVAVTAYFLPFGFGNRHVLRLVRSFAPTTGGKADGFVVQLTVFPRLRTGLRGLLEDADDIGYLRVTGNELVYQGDSVRLNLPLELIEKVEQRNIGLRVPFIHGWRMRLSVTGLRGIEFIEFAERSSCLLPTSRAVTRELYAQLTAAVPGQRAPSAAPP
jgi:hypothetical protein